jgi:hypothetical protein
MSITTLKALYSCTAALFQFNNAKTGINFGLNDYFENTTKVRGAQLCLQTYRPVPYFQASPLSEMNCRPREHFKA